MRTAFPNRHALYSVEDGCLVRTVISSDGRRYVHRCERKAFETVAHAIEETPAQGEGTSLMQIARQEKLPFTQVNVALEYLKERGIVDVRHRRCYPGTSSVHLDAMVEFHALADGAAGKEG
jgi:hypothetical protein